MTEAPDANSSVALPQPRSDAATLLAFVAVARAGTVARAAEMLGRTQPSISARLASLEQAWGTRLFRRRSRGMLLTPEGAQLLPMAESLLRGLEQIDRAAGLPVAPPGELRVGAGDALGRERLPGALARLIKRLPGLEVHLREGPAPRLIEALRDGEIDLALVVGPPPGSTGNGIAVQPCIESEVRLLVHRGHSMRTRKSVRLSNLAEERLVALQPGSGFRRHMETAFAAAGIGIRPAVEVGNLSLVRRCVAAGLGVAPVPAVAFSSRDRFQGVRALDLSGAPRVTYYLAHRSGAPLSDAARLLISLL